MINSVFLDEYSIYLCSILACIAIYLYLFQKTDQFILLILTCLSLFFFFSRLNVNVDKIDYTRAGGMVLCAGLMAVYLSLTNQIKGTSPAPLIVFTALFLISFSCSGNNLSSSETHLAYTITLLLPSLLFYILNSQFMYEKRTPRKEMRKMCIPLCCMIVIYTYTVMKKSI